MPGFVLENDLKFWLRKDLINKYLRFINDQFKLNFLMYELETYSVSKTVN